MGGNGDDGLRPREVTQDSRSTAAGIVIPRRKILKPRSIVNCYCELYVLLQLKITVLR